MDIDTNNLYIFMPSSLSGDLWHVAAALILSSRYAKDDKFPFNIVVAMACTKYTPNPDLETILAKMKVDADAAQAELDAKVKPDKDTAKLLNAKISNYRKFAGSVDFQKAEKKFGSVSFNYFRNLGLETLLIEADLGSQLPSIGSLEKAIRSMPDRFFDHVYQDQKNFKYSFEDMLKQPQGKFGYKDAPIVKTDRVLPLMTATTIAINFLCHQKGNVDPERYNWLSRRMCAANVDAIEATVEKAANEKYQQLSQLVEKTLTMKTPKGEVYTRAILENYRVNRTNYQTNSNPKLSEFFKQLADAGKMAVIKIPAVNDLAWLAKLKAEEGALVFDLYGLGEGVPYPGLEARAQARFWAKVAADPRIAGIFGGRSGSIDVAGFSGMNAFFWDEPWIEWCAGLLGDTQLGINNKLNRSDAKQQIPQCLRSLQLLAIMGVGLPTDREQLDGGKLGVWQAVRKEQIEQWFSTLEVGKRFLDLGHSIYPRLPGFDVWRVVSF
jgi:hypothetical protein